MRWLLTLAAAVAITPVLRRADEAPPGQPRFVAPDGDTLRAAIFAWWDLLDRQMEARSEGAPPWMYGYIRSGAQLDTYLAAVTRAGVSRYCEIGFNGGHGTVAMLLANPNLTVVSFDLAQYPYSNRSMALLLESFPGRLRILKGSSYGRPVTREFLKNKRALPAADGPCDAERDGVATCYARAVQRGAERPCDVMLIDGDHSKDGVLADLSIMAHMAPCGAHTLLMDDIADTTNVGVAVDQVRKSRFIDVTHHAVFAQNSDPDNPCMRWKDKVVHAQKGVRCAHRWGFLEARFTKPPLCETRTRRRERAGAAAAPTAP